MKISDKKGKIQRIIDNLLSTFLVLLFLNFLPILFSIDFLDVLQNAVEDFYITDVVFSDIQDPETIPPDTNIVIVNIGHLERWQIAEQINIMNQYGPKVIGIDSFFRTDKGEENDIPLAEAFAGTENLVLGSQLFSPDPVTGIFDTVMLSNEKFMQYAEPGFVNFITDDEEEYRMVREFSPKEKLKGEDEHDNIHLSFPARIANYISPEKVDRLIKRNNKKEIINFKRNIDPEQSNRYRAIDAFEIFEKRDSLHFLKDKIVLMGFLGNNLQILVTEDIFFTPMNEHYYGRSYPDMYGVVVHANVISMILDEDYFNTMTTISDWFPNIALFILVYFNMMFLNYIRINYVKFYEPANLVLMFGEMLAIFVIVLYVFYNFHFELKMQDKNTPFYAILLSGTLFETYHGSLKPISLSLFNSIKQKLLKK